MSPLLQYCLPALGICRNFPRKLVFAPCDFMGLNLGHLFTLQEIARIKEIKKLGCDTNYAWSSALIDNLATASLIKTTWQFLHSNSFTLKHDITLVLPRHRDQFLMEAFLSLPISEHELVACNHCRMYL
jgi:hypothetical protein